MRSCRRISLYQALRYRKYIRNLPQRLGYLPLSFNFDGDESIWIHAVSVGEVLTARALLPQLRERYPRLRIFLSTTTMTGQHVARTNVHDVDGVFYFPLDLPLVVRRTLAVVKPRLFIMMETELWPNLLRACRRAGVKTVLVNGRISARSYPRYRLARRFFRRVLDDVDRFCMQSEESARRIIEIGAPRERVTVTGSLKFDSLEIPGARAGSRPQPRAALFPHSARAAGDDRRLDAAGGRRAGARGVPADPRHLGQRAAHHRAAEAGALRRGRAAGAAARLARGAPQASCRSTPSRASTWSSSTPSASWRSCTRSPRLVFVGGSLVDAGGHNILEPAVFGKPIVFGPHMHNFAEISRTFLENRGAVQVHSATELETVLVDLLSDPVRRASLGAAARALVEANRGARQRTLAVITQLLPSDGSGTVLPFRASEMR